MECANCGNVIVERAPGVWVHWTLGVVYCHTQFPETLYNNWDKRVAVPESTN